jgi:hypothetical protein
MPLNDNSWSALYQAQLTRYQTVFEADHNMDTKNGLTFGAVFAVAVFVLDKSLFITQNKWIFTGLMIGCLLYIVTIGLLLFALKPRSYTLPANTTQDHTEYLTMEDSTLMYQLVTDTEYAADTIEKNLQMKAVMHIITTILFTVGTILLLAVKLIGG